MAYKAPMNPINAKMHWYNAQMRAIALARAKAITELRKAGKTWAEVGAELGISRQRAQKIGSRVA